MYTSTNFKTKKALKEALSKGHVINTYQPGGMFPPLTDGETTIEGPHYPQPHRWYARVVVRDSVVVRVLG